MSFFFEYHLHSGFVRCNPICELTSISRPLLCPRHWGYDMIPASYWREGKTDTLQISKSDGRVSVIRAAKTSHGALEA